MCNDIITPLIDLYKEFKKEDLIYIIKYIDNTINTYNLNKINNDGYLKLRKDYNLNKTPLDLMVLIAYCYNNQIRFNSNFGFNRAFGLNRSEFNEKMRSNLISFIDKLHMINIEFNNTNYIEYIKELNLHTYDFVYTDPPYLITNADYSIQAKWNEEKEKDLLNILDDLNTNNIKFALSNVLKHNDKENLILKEWSKKYNIHILNQDYGNCNAVKKQKNGQSIEVLITNY